MGRLPRRWRDPDATARPCDKCPGEAAHVVYRGREWGLCEGCYQRFVLGR